MADSIIQLPYTATTSGDTLDATLLGAVKRERMVLGNDASTAVAVVTSSGALNVSADVTGSFPFIISGSVTANLSSATSLSSGIVTLSSNPTVVSASSGLVQVLQSTGVWAVSGTVTVGNPSTAPNLAGSTGTLAVVTSAGGLNVSIVSSGGIMAPVTSSAGLLVNASITGGAASTGVNLLGTANEVASISSAGVLEVQIYSSGGIAAPVTSSYGLQVSARTTGRTLGSITTTAGAPLTVALTTAKLWLYSIVMTATGSGTAGNAIGVYSATSALSSQTPLLRFTNQAAAYQHQMVFPSGVLFSNGLQVAVSVTFNSTGNNTAQGIAFSIEYEV